MSLNRRSIRIVFLLQLAIISLVVVLVMLWLAEANRNLPFATVTMIAITLAFGSIVAATWMTYRATRRLLAPVDWLLREVSSWDPQRPDTRALSPDQIPAEIKGDIRKMAKEVMEIPVDESVVNKIDFNCEGNLRKAIKIMYIIERAKTTNPQLSIADLDLGRDL